MKKVQTHLKYGGLTGLAMVIVSLLVYILDKDMDSSMGFLIYIPFIVGIIMNATAYSKANAHDITFGNAYGSCFKASCIIALVMVAYSVLSIFIFPEMKEKGMEIAYQKMSENEAMTDEQIDQWMDGMSKYYIPMTIGAIMFSMIFWGAILSLLGAAIAKKNPKGMPQA